MTVKPVNTEADWEEVFARKVKTLKKLLVCVCKKGQKMQTKRNNKLRNMKFKRSVAHSVSLNSINTIEYLPCQANQTKSLQVHFNRQKCDFECVQTAPHAKY